MRDLLSQIPAEFLRTRYSADRYPGIAQGLKDGANCQHFCFEVLRYFGFTIGNLRSSDLFADTEFTSITAEIEPFDLILFHREPNAYGAHVGLCVGQNKILHLSEKIGTPIVWDLDQFSNDDDYKYLVGAKRPVSRGEKFSAVKSVTEVDIPMLDYNLSIPIEDRIRNHERSRRVANELREAGRGVYGSGKS